MSRRSTTQSMGACFFVTTTFKNRRDLGKVQGLYEALVDSILYYSEKYSAHIIGYVLMPTHIHLLLLLENKKLSDFMRDFKKFTSQKAAVDLGLKGDGIWMPRYDRVSIYNLEVLKTKLDYIHLYPLKSGLVYKPEDWKWSSAGDYFLGLKGLIPVYKDWG